MNGGRKMAEKIILELTREHAQVVQDACEMLMRMKLGQPSFPTELLLGWPSHERMSTDEFCLRRDMANEIMRTYLFAVLGRNNYGYPDGRKDDTEALAYEVWGTIRHETYKYYYQDDDFYDVRSQEPMNESGKTMPKCRIEEG